MDLARGTMIGCFARRPIAMFVTGLGAHHMRVAVRVVRQRVRMREPAAGKREHDCEDGNDKAAGRVGAAAGMHRIS